MPQARLIIKKRPRGEYEIGTYTEDGSIVAHVSLRDGGASDARTEAEREDAALEQVCACSRRSSGSWRRRRRQAATTLLPLGRRCPKGG